MERSSDGPFPAIQMIDDRFRNFCIVGVGGHARTKLIPAIEANGQQVTAVVSSQPAKNFPAASVFVRLEQAIEKLPRDTTFLIATPPALHFEQARLVLQEGFDLFLEKPAFVTGPEAEEVVSLCNGKPVVLVEAFMHRYTRLYSELLQVWTSSRSPVRRIELTFLIPNMPAGTFRSESRITSSVLFDIGCYPISLLADIGLGTANLEVSQLQFAGNPDKMRIGLAGSAGKIAIAIDIGVGDAYANSVCLHLDDGETICFSPFFFGRKADRSIATSSHGDTGIRTLHDENAFEVMLARPRGAWLGDQAERCRQMIEVAGRLEGLAKEVLAASARLP
jgi:predicted dehydrogenase